MSAREILAYAITHAPPGVKGGPYEGCGAIGGASAHLGCALRWPDAGGGMWARDALASVRRSVPHARVIRIVRARPSQQPSEASAVEVLRELASYPGNGGDLARIQARARRVLAAAGDPLALTVRAEKAERERDDLLARINDAEEAARALRAELARLTALDRATDDELVDLYRKIYETHGGGTISVSHDDCRRAGLLAVAARVRQERARQQPAKDRATDEELGRVFGEAYTVEESPDHGVALRTAYLAVAAHVRQERCLVAEAVGMGTGVTISRTSERVPGTTGMWDVYVTRRPDVPGEHYAYGVPTADVPATLARLLGEVSRG